VTVGQGYKVFEVHWPLSNVPDDFLVGPEAGFEGICLILSQKLTIIHAIRIFLLPDPLLTQI
jgi:hypothetical protein